MLRFEVITIFPDIIKNYLSYGVLSKGIQKGLFEVNTTNLRDFASDNYKTVDDKPYGGGHGMVMLLEVWVKALYHVQTILKNNNYKYETWLLTPTGDLFTQNLAQLIAKKQKIENKAIIFLCGRYEGIDARIEHYIDKKVSIGPYVLTGGELGTLVIIDSIARLIPGVLGNDQSSQEETQFYLKDKKILVEKEQPQYTRPSKYKDPITKKIYTVPSVLLSGHHQKVQEWKAKKKKQQDIQI